jgi:nicotinate phosphoribosyltransferase
MAYGYWKTGEEEREAVFHLSFRNNPFRGGFSVACGLDDAVEYLQNLAFEEDDLAYLATLNGSDGQPLFETAFLDHLRSLRWTCDVDAVAEGTVVFPHEPLVRVQGPLLQCQLVETALLNILNFQTLIATKAARIGQAAEGQPVLEFGLRRAQGSDGALTASRAAYIGGCAATSNVLAGKLFGIPVRGTHAHSWVMAFPSEQEAFAAYASAAPNNCLFLVDTYNTLHGIEHAIAEARRLRAEGHEFLGIRLDSGDLAYLSIEARRMLDAAGFESASIFATNDLDEYIITSLKSQGARIDCWGVGTRLVTSYEQPALGGVYKLGAIRSPGGSWEHKIKLSEQPDKISTPGLQQIRRFRTEDGFIGDMIYSTDSDSEDERIIIDRIDPTRRKHLPAEAIAEDLLQPIFRQGKLVSPRPSIVDSRTRLQNQLANLHPGIKRFLNPHSYPAGLSPSLHDLRTRLILEARGEDG